ncbi:unnamed protein product [Cyprideis torosa]|uniref:Uncharacterized protein n=1 Tax=Cyprideis torosa TaxID=163714 RepID=A0A7R8WCY4_9CRUS|nr:unnamed protein product [Cyprideis torosa]CAG0888811.1 unnamed protein product [Cyprideis torosa]
MDPPDPLSPSEVIDESETNLMRLRSGKRISEPPIHDVVQQESTAASSSSNSAASPPVAPAPTPTPTATSSTSATPAVYSAPADPLPPPVLMSRSQFLAALSFVVFVVVIGVPVWWATTGTYRAVLPHTDIASFSSSLRLDTSIPVTIWISSSRNRRTVESTVAQIKMLNSEFVSYDVNVASVPPAILKSFEASSNLSEEHKVLELLGEEEGVVNIVEVPARLLSSQIHVGSHRTIFVASDNVAEAVLFFMSRFSNIVLHVAIQQFGFHVAIQPSLSCLSLSTDAAFPDADLALVLTHVVGDAALKQEVARWKNAELEVDSNQLRRVPSHGTYNLIFSLLNPSPDLIRADWKPHLAFQGYLQPFMEKLSGLANFHVSSQSLYFLPLPVKGKWNDGLGCRVIPASHLPHVITPFEAKLGES